MSGIKSRGFEKNGADDGGGGHIFAAIFMPEVLSLTAECHNAVSALNIDVGRNQLLNRLHHNFNYISTTMMVDTAGRQSPAGNQMPNRHPLPPHALNL